MEFLLPNDGSPLLEVKESLIMAFSYVNCSDTIHSTDWSVLKDCVELLEPLHELTEEISGERYCTSSFVIPLMRGCQRAVKEVNPATAIGEQLKTCLSEALSKRMTPYESNSSGICAKATILDPRFKKCAFGLPSNASNAVEELIKEINCSVVSPSDIGGVVTQEGTVEQTQSTESEKKKKKIWNFFLEQKGKFSNFYEYIIKCLIYNV